MFIIFLTLYHRLCIKVGRSHCEITDVLVAFWKLIVDLFFESDVTTFRQEWTNMDTFKHYNGAMSLTNKIPDFHLTNWSTNFFTLPHTDFTTQQAIIYGYSIKNAPKDTNMIRRSSSVTAVPHTYFHYVSRRRGEQSHERAATVSYDHCMNCCFWPLDWKRGAEKDICKNSGFKGWFLSPLQAKASIKLNSGTIT